MDAYAKEQVIKELEKMCQKSEYKFIVLSQERNVSGGFDVVFMGELENRIKELKQKQDE